MDEMVVAFQMVEVVEAAGRVQVVGAVQVI